MAFSISSWTSNAREAIERQSKKPPGSISNSDEGNSLTNKGGVKEEDGDNTLTNRAKDPTKGNMLDVVG